MKKIMTSNDWIFIKYLESLQTREDRRALASLRRGLGKKPGTSWEMYPYVARYIPEAAKQWEADIYYLVAFLFASYNGPPWPEDSKRDTRSNLGVSFAQLAAKSDSSSIEARFVVLLNSHVEDLGNHLRYSISLLSSRSIPVNWVRLLADLKGWKWEDKTIQRRWSRSFWGFHSYVLSDVDQDIEITDDPVIELSDGK